MTEDDDDLLPAFTLPPNDAHPGNIAYAVSRPSMGQRIQQAWHESYTHETLTGHQIAIAFLYGQPPAGRTYRVHIYNISAGWF